MNLLLYIPFYFNKNYIRINKIIIYITKIKTIKKVIKMAWDDKQTKVWFDGNFIEWKDANISLLSHVVHYGTSVFEGIRAYHNEKGTAVLGWHAVDSNNLTSNACYIPSESSCTVNYYTGEGIFTGSLGQTIIVDDSYECVHVNHQSMYGYSSSGSLGFAKTGNLYVRTDSVTGATIEEMGYKFFYYYESASLSVSITFSWPSISVSSGMTLARNRACTLNKNGVLTQYSY